MSIIECSFWKPNIFSVRNYLLGLVRCRYPASLSAGHRGQVTPDMERGYAFIFNFQRNIFQQNLSILSLIYFCCYHCLLGIQGQKSPTETRKALDNVHYLFYIFLLTLTWTFENEILDWKSAFCYSWCEENDARNSIWQLWIWFCKLSMCVALIYYACRYYPSSTNEWW